MKRKKVVRQVPMPNASMQKVKEEMSAGYSQSIKLFTTALKDAVKK